MPRHQTTGRFQTYEELVEWVWWAWEKTPACIADIARQCRVGTGVVSKILDKGKP